jgi:hypothetical protein
VAGESEDRRVKKVVEPATGPPPGKISFEEYAPAFSACGGESPLPEGKSLASRGNTEEVTSGAPDDTAAGGIASLDECWETNVNELVAERICFLAILCK